MWWMGKARAILELTTIPKPLPEPSIISLSNTHSLDFFFGHTSFDFDSSFHGSYYLILRGSEAWRFFWMGAREAWMDGWRC